MNKNKKVSAVFAILVIAIVGIFLTVIICLKGEEVSADSETATLINNWQIYKDIKRAGTNDPQVNASFLGNKVTAYITDVTNDTGGSYVYVTPVTILTGQAALKAKIEDGKCQIAGEDKATMEAEVEESGMEKLPEKFIACQPASYYVQSQSDSEMKLAVSPDVQILQAPEISGDYTGSTPLNLDQFQADFQAKKNDLQDLPFDLELENQQVTKMSQLYMPQT